MSRGVSGRAHEARRVTAAQWEADALLRSLSLQGALLVSRPKPRVEPWAIACRPWRD